MLRRITPTCNVVVRLLKIRLRRLLFMPPKKDNLFPGLVLKQMKLLLLDPLVLVRERLGAMLDSLDFVEVEIANTLEDSIQIVRSIRPEIVILRARMPDGGSIEMLTMVKSVCPSICLIVVSDLDLSEVYVKRWRLAGADYCFDLFLQLDQLLDTVRQLGISNAHADRSIST